MGKCLRALCIAVLLFAGIGFFGSGELNNEPALFVDPELGDLD